MGRKRKKSDKTKHINETLLESKEATEGAAEEPKEGAEAAEEAKETTQQEGSAEAAEEAKETTQQEGSAEEPKEGAEAAEEAKETTQQEGAAEEPKEGAEAAEEAKESTQQESSAEEPKEGAEAAEEAKDTNAADKKNFVKRHKGIFCMLGVLLIAGLSYFGYVQYQNWANGWKYMDDGSWRYLIQTKPVTGITTVEGRAYYFDESGYLNFGWVSANGITRYQDYEQGIYTGEQEIAGEKYQFQSDGAFLSGAYEIEGVSYLRNAYGYPEVGLVTVGDNTYYTDENCAIQEGWQKLELGRYYFVPETGAMAVGLMEIDGETYYFGENGVLTQGWIDFEEGTRYFDLSYHMVTGPYKEVNREYLFDENGFVFKGYLNENGKVYYYSEEDGTLFHGWMKEEDTYYYFQEDGSRAQGWTEIDGKTYYFDDDGAMLTGWQTIDGTKYYFVSAGYKATGFTAMEGQVFYFDSEGQRLETGGWHTLGGKRYYLQENGAITTGLIEIANKTYFLDENGAMCVGFRTINGKRYYFYDSGEMARNTTVGLYQIDADGVATNPYEVITPENLDAYIQVLLNTYGRDVLSIFQFCRNNFSYRYRDKLDLNSMACRMLNNGNGACWDYAALCYKMLTAAGYNCQIVVGRGAVFSEHNWLLIEISPGVWRHIDPERQGLWIYMLTDDELAAYDGISRGVRYQWDRSAYPAAE